MAYSVLKHKGFRNARFFLKIVYHCKSIVIVMRTCGIFFSPILLMGITAAFPLRLYSQFATKKVTAVKIEEPPVIDGKLQDSCWKDIIPATTFVQKEPYRGKLAMEQAEVYIVHDGKKIYFGFRCYDSQPDKIVATLTKRDAPLWQDDAVEIFLDTFHDRRSCYFFMTNLLGAKLDGRVSDEGRVVDDKWDAHWETASSITSEGWECEIAIPFSEIRYKYEENPVWGINFYRTQKSKREDSYWVNTGENIFAVSQFGDLIGLKLPEERRPIEVTPYVTGRYEEYVENEDIEYKTRVGIEIKHFLTSNLTANVTLQPDFAHIEADHDQFNLSYEKGEELYLKEKRPFFLEGIELLKTPFNLFYTRRMNEIMYGGKITGRIWHTNLTLMNAQTADTDENFSALRLQRDILGGGTVGILASNNEYLEGYSRVIGLDASIPITEEARITTQICKSINPQIKGKNWAGLLKMRYRARTISFGGKYEDIGTNFDVRQGFIPYYRRGKRGGNIWGELTYPRNRYGLQWIKTGIYYTRRESHEGVLTNQSINPLIQILGKNNLYFWIYGDISTERYGDKVFHNHSTTITFCTNYGEWTGFCAQYQWGEHYGSDLQYIVGTASFALIKNIMMDLQATNLTLNRDSEWIGNMGINYQIKKNLFWRVFLQKNTEEKTFNVNTLLGYHISPRAVLYLAYNGVRKGVGSDKSPTNRVIFLKFTYGLLL